MIVGRLKIAFGCGPTVIVRKRLTRQYITLKFILNNHIEYKKILNVRNLSFTHDMAMSLSRKKYKYLLKFSLHSFRNNLIYQLKTKTWYLY